MTTHGPPGGSTDDSNWENSPPSRVLADSIDRARKINDGASQLPMTAAKFEAFQLQTGDSEGTEDITSPDTLTPGILDTRIPIQQILSSEEILSLQKKLAEVRRGSSNNTSVIPSRSQIQAELDEHAVVNTQNKLLEPLRASMSDFSETARHGNYLQSFKSDPADPEFGKILERSGNDLRTTNAMGLFAATSPHTLSPRLQPVSQEKPEVSLDIDISMPTIGYPTQVLGAKEVPTGAEVTADRIPVLTEKTTQQGPVIQRGNPVRGTWFNRKREKPQKIDLGMLGIKSHNVHKETVAVSDKKPVMRGNIFTRGFKKALKSITTSFTKMGAVEASEGKKLDGAEDNDLMFLTGQDESDNSIHFKELDNPKKKAVEEAAPKTIFSTPDIYHDRYREIMLKEKEAKRLEEQREKEELITKGLDAVTLTTSKKRFATFEKLGPWGTKLLNGFDKGAHFLERQVRKKIRLGAGIGLAATAVLALYATPAIGTIAVITAAGVGARVLVASAAYVGMKRMIDSVIKETDHYNETRRDEDDPLKNFKVGQNEKTLAALGAALGAAVIGQLVGEYLAPALGNLMKVYFPHINDVIATIYREGALKWSPGPLYNDISHLVTQTPIHEKIPATLPVITPDVVTFPSLETPVPLLSPEVLHHPVKPGENLWSIVKTMMQDSNFDGFNELANENLREAKIVEALSRLPQDPREYGITGGNINTIEPGQILNLTKAFTK